MLHLFLLAALHQSPAAPLFDLRGSSPGGRYGSAIAGLGDLDGDGRGDLIVGAPRALVGGERRGRATVHSGADGKVLFTYSGSGAHGIFGFSVAGGGDVDRDGTPDFIVGAPRDGSPAGTVTVFSGATGQRLYSLRGAAAGDEYGTSVAIIGDVNGDNHADLLIGAPNHDSGGSNAGRVYLISGRTRVSLAIIDGEAWDFLGTSVAAAGDLDGDGKNDVWIGAPFNDSGSFNAGSAYAHSGVTGARLHTISGASAGDQLGFRVAAAGDIDGDGVTDLLACAPSADATGLDSGSLVLVSGASGDLSATHAGWSASIFASAVAGVGDLDGDGHPDLLLGAAAAHGSAADSGAVHAFGGASGNELFALDGRQAGDWFGAALANVGDIDGDGQDDFAVGAPGHDDQGEKTGYVRVYSGAAFAP
ncbi:MAG: hypothetical protein ABGY71_15775 [bacterium]|nr:hypothetical protein [Planctomycetota bacterium]HIL52343.1 hypothetical protein [Planctomycetota bacterium]